MKILISLSVVLLASAVFIACDNSSSKDSSSTSASYQGAGSRWTASFVGGTFTIKKYASAAATTETISITGSYEDYSTGFRKLTVATASGVGAPSVGAIGYGLEIPGLAFIL